MKELRHPLVIGLVVLFSIAAFFATVFSGLSIWPKTAVSLLVLVLCGFALHKLTGIESFYGFLMVRSLAGFNLMEAIAKAHPKWLREATDAGATLAFGIPFGAKVFGWKKALMHGLLVAAFLALMLEARFVSALSVLLPGGESYFLALGLLAGLAGMGLLGIAINAYAVLTVPNTPAGVQLLIPGVTVPWEAIFAIAIIAIVHEMAHGVMCYVEKLPLKSSGVLLFGFLPVGAFVEPDEEKLEKVSLEKKRRILVAGSASNALFFVIFFFFAKLLALAAPLLIAGVAVSEIPQNSTLSGLALAGALLVSVDGKPVKTFEGVFGSVSATNNPVAVFEKAGSRTQAPLMDLVVSKVETGFPASSLLAVGERIKAVEGQIVRLPSDVGVALKGKKQGDVIALDTSAGKKSVSLGENGRIGITVSLSPVATFENRPFAGLETVYGAWAFLIIVVSFTYLLNLLIAIINLLPLFVTDGQKMIFYELEPWLKHDLAVRVSVVMGLIVLSILLINALPHFW